ncbi:MAG TPA: adenylate/guanylate cyclase domain-containing protein [Phototrophicaceae bacterium]|nr:adenylate/guanylate cyclase domain-containing protein [Phototrophicaceae bacterium]
MTESPNQPTTSLSDIDRLRTYVKEVFTALRNQQEILRKRGMTLPVGTLSNLEQIDGEFQTLAKQLVSENTELSQLRSLTATSALINSSLDLDTVLSRAMDEVLRLTGAERGYIVLREAPTGTLDVRVIRDRENPAASSFQGSQTILNEVLETGQPLRTENAYKDPRMQGNVSIAHTVLRSVVCVPLTYRGTVIGAVYVDNRLRTGVFTAREENLLVAFANQGAIAIENARLFARAQVILAETIELQELMANVFDSIGSGVITTNGQDIITTYNPAAADILGHPADTAVGQPLLRVLPKISADFNEHLQAVRERNANQLVETELDVPERGRMIVNLKLSPLKDTQQQTQGVALVLDDVTEQREREEKLTILRRYLPPALVENIHEISGLALGGERRDVTCVFVDVRTLSTFPRDLRPRQVMELLNEYLRVATDCIHQANGVIDKYMGTEIMALFNSQLNPMNDHANRAVQAALVLRQAYQAFYAQQGLQPEMAFFRVGIHTGVATLGNVGSLSRRDFTALGDTINLSHRLLENARPGQIIISDATCQAVHADQSHDSSRIRFEERDPIKVKGRQQATSVYEVFKV